MRGMEDAFPSVDIPFQQEFEGEQNISALKSFAVAAPVCGIRAVKASCLQVRDVARR